MEDFLNESKNHFLLLGFLLNVAGFSLGRIFLVVSLVFWLVSVLYYHPE